MMRTVSGSTHTGDSDLVSNYLHKDDSGSVVRTRRLRSVFALGMLFVTTAAGYGVAFMVIDLVYKGGSFGIL